MENHFFRVYLYVGGLIMVIVIVIAKVVSGVRSDARPICADLRRGGSFWVEKVVKIQHVIQLRYFIVRGSNI